MGVYWNDSNRAWLRSQERAAQNVMLQTHGTSGSVGGVSSASGIHYYVDVNGHQTSTQGASGAGAPGRAAQGAQGLPAAEAPAVRPQRLAELVAAGQGDGKLTLARREEQEIAALEQSVARLSDELAGLSALVSTERSEVSRHAQSEASVGRELARHGLPAQHRVGLPPKRPLEAQMSAIQARKAGAQQHLSADQTALAAKKAELERAQGALALAERGRTVSRAELREVDPELVAKNEATLAAIGKPAPAGEVDLEALAKLPKPERARALDRERTRVETELNALESAPAAATTEARTAANTRQGELFNRLVRIEELLQGTELGARK